ncbi:MAG: NAD-dependent epimerase/dehydratase family protein [Candidatus Kapaibacteriales bacterium]
MQLKTIAVTGANGFVGSHVIDKLIYRGDFNVIALVRPNSDTKWLNTKNCEIRRTDFYSIDDIEKNISDTDIIIHVGGRVAAPSYDEFYKANVEVTLNIAEAAKNLQRKNNSRLHRFLLVSSQTASGPSDSLGSPKRPDDECKPLSRYGVSKHKAEVELLDRFGDDLDFTIVRPPAVFGPRDTAILDVFKAIHKGVAPLIGFSDKYVTLVYVEDLANAVLDAALSEKTKAKTYFVGTERPYSWKDINKMLSTAKGGKVINIPLPEFIVKLFGFVSETIGGSNGKTPVFDREKAVDFIQPYWICDVSSATKDFGYKNQNSLIENLTKTYKWYLDQGWL